MAYMGPHGVHYAMSFRLAHPMILRMSYGTSHGNDRNAQLPMG